MPRPSYQPSDEQRKVVKTMAAFGTPQDDIAVVLDIAPKTLRKHFRSDLDRGSIEANAKVMQTLFGMATSGTNTAASIFWAKTRCGLQERWYIREREPAVPPQIIVRTSKAEEKP
jgi:hypothetical protein